MNSQPEKPALRLDWCSYQAAKYAVEHWHYSRVMPAGKAVIVGAWECGKFIGVVIFSRGANNNLSKAYGLKQTECCELTRIALTDHAAPVSRIAALALRFLKKQSPGVRLVVSYADPEQGHHGGIYQGMNWIYDGKSNGQAGFVVINGKTFHKRSVSSKYGNAKPSFLKTLGLDASYGPNLWKHRYLMPLDADMRKRIIPLSKPYPKRAGSDTKDTAGHHPAEGGSTPTPALPS